MRRLLANVAAVMLASGASASFHSMPTPLSYRWRLTPYRGRAMPASVVLLDTSVLDISAAWDSYNAALETQPLLTKSLTASVLLAAADFSAQSLEGEDPVDLARVVRFAIFGLVLQAPWNHFYYMALDGAIPPTPEPLSPTNLAKVGIDQFVQAPIFTAIIFIFLGSLEGLSKDAIQRKLQIDWWPTMQANWKLWIPATAVNIALVPPVLRVLYINIVFFFWSIFLSTVANNETPSENADSLSS
eukprot:CAMPEP_0119314014 /NCGR_PEP_ID=MMETSP1333-20130426/31295_1 /TAXON_ID=418940 /ORGANISM="Scyphosphaera apsteinii, Strain RCC1455" /LENGTH=243 /DNA_ID=CAMNT_0007319023 /DNA_START=13 /DNA_END=744 /DNA_ORIENTATION=-